MLHALAEAMTIASQDTITAANASAQARNPLKVNAKSMQMDRVPDATDGDADVRAALQPLRLLPGDLRNILCQINETGFRYGKVEFCFLLAGTCVDSTHSEYNWRPPRHPVAESRS